MRGNRVIWRSEGFVRKITRSTSDEPKLNAENITLKFGANYCPLQSFLSLRYQRLDASLIPVSISCFATGFPKLRQPWNNNFDPSSWKVICSRISSLCIIYFWDYVKHVSVLDSSVAHLANGLFLRSPLKKVVPRTGFAERYERVCPFKLSLLTGCSAEPGRARQGQRLFTYRILRHAQGRDRMSARGARRTSPVPSRLSSREGHEGTNTGHPGEDHVEDPVTTGCASSQGPGKGGNGLG